jgi:mannitol-specific phosphotransferase system IIBC component
MNPLEQPNLGAIVISTIVTIAFVAITAYAMVHGVQDNPTFQQLIGAMTSAFSMVVGYWIGSSNSSQKKDAVIATVAAKEAKP